MKKVTLQIDGTAVEAQEGQTVLQAAQAAEIYIPTLCSHPDLTPQGGCKLCVVEIDGVEGPQTSCTTKAEEGMVVTTQSANLSKVRNLAMELILASHPGECTSCPVYLNCELQAMIQYLGATHSRLRTIKKKNVNLAIKNKLIVRDMERCIQCGRCVRACSEMRGVDVLAYNKKDGETYVSTHDDKSFDDANCRYCGACVEVCPTGALRDLDGLFSKESPREQALVPCTNRCPAHIDVPEYIRLIGEEKYSESVAVIREKVPFPHALGFICSRKCEEDCRREKLNEPISIRNLKRHAVENDSTMYWKEKASSKAAATGKKVAVVGAGPAGLTASLYLAKKGHTVTLYEKLPNAGGMLRAGIPSYRLPREALQGEIDFITGLGVELVTGKNVDSAAGLLGNGFDSVAVTTGCHAGRKLGIPGNDFANVITAVDFLRAAYADEQPIDVTGKKIVVLGGGNVSFDVARTSVRLGAASVDLMCLEARENMLADKEEVEEGIEEGVNVHNGRTFLAIEGSAAGVTGIKHQDIKGFSFDQDGLHVDAVEGSDSVTEADILIFAAGQMSHLDAGFGLELERGNFVKIDAVTLATSVDGIFAGGDAVTGTRFVIDAIAAGRELATNIDKYLGGDGNIDEVLYERSEHDGKLPPVEEFALLKRQEPGIAAVDERKSSFTTVECSMDKGCAKSEAERCLQCDLRTDISQVRFWSDYATSNSSANK